MITTIVLLDGKYTVQHNNGANFKALRYGEEWRDLTGDGLVLALVQEIERLKEYPQVEYPSGKGILIAPEEDKNGVVIVLDESGEYKRVAKTAIRFVEE